MYTQAIQCKVPPKKKAVYYCNRALMNLKLENYAIALFDAKDSVKCDETYVKAYYRRGSSYVALNQLDMAIKDFKKVCQLEPQNKDARQKYELTMKEHKLREFAKCLGYDNTKVEVNVQDMPVEDSYTGPRLEKAEDLNREWVLSLLDY